MAEPKIHYARLDAAVTLCGRSCYRSPAGRLPNVTALDEEATCRSCRKILDEWQWRDQGGGHW